MYFFMQDMCRMSQSDRQWAFCELHGNRLASRVFLLPCLQSANIWLRGNFLVNFLRNCFNILSLQQNDAVLHVGKSSIPQKLLHGVLSPKMWRLQEICKNQWIICITLYLFCFIRGFLVFCIYYALINNWSVQIRLWNPGEWKFSLFFLVATSVFVNIWLHACFMLCYLSPLFIVWKL